MTGPDELLALVKHEATKFGRCCDLYQDGFGTFADHECQQRTFAMLRGVQQVLGVAKNGSPLSEEEIVAVRARARLLSVAHEMKEALIQARDALTVDAMVDSKGNRFSTTVVAMEAIDAVLAKLGG